MVINDVHNDADTPVVQSLNHLLEFLDSDLAVIRVRRIRAFRNIVVDRVIAPVILRLVELCFVNGAVIIHRV